MIEDRCIIFETSTALWAASHCDMSIVNDDLESLNVEDVNIDEGWRSLAELQTRLCTAYTLILSSSTDVGPYQPIYSTFIFISVALKLI